MSFLFPWSVQCETLSFCGYPMVMSLHFAHTSSARVALPNIMDIEASGFGDQSYPIEVGVALSNGKRFCSLITPPGNWTHWSESAEDIHGISRRALFEHGRSLTEVCHELNEMLGGMELYSDAWSHDDRWLRKLFYTARVNPQFRLSAIEFLASEQQIGVWDETKREVVEEQKLKRHRASNDAHIIQQTFLQSYLKTTLDSKTA